MSIWTRASLNRIALIGECSDYDYNELENNYIEPLKDLCEEFNLSIEYAPKDSYSTYYLVIHNNGSETGDTYYDGDISDLPVIRNDDTFYQRTEDFIKKAIEIVPEIKDLKFEEAKARVFTFS